MTEQLAIRAEENLIPDQDAAMQHPDLAMTVQIMERLHASEVFATPEQSKEFLDSLNYEEFKGFISFVNGVERGIPVTERGRVSDSYVKSDSILFGSGIEYRPPHQSYRERLLKKAFEKAQSVEGPEIAGLTLGLSLNAIHYFEDGNGRTARLTYALLAKGYDGSPKDQKYYSSLLENTKGREIVDLNPFNSGIDRQILKEMFAEAQKKYGYDTAFSDKQPIYVFDGYRGVFAGEETSKDLAVSDDIDDAGRAMLFRTMESTDTAMTSLMASFDPARVKDFVRTSTDGSRTVIDGNAFFPTLTQEEISNWWHNSERIISVYVSRLIKVSDRQDVAEIAAEYRGSEK